MSREIKFRAMVPVNLNEPKRMEFFDLSKVDDLNRLTYADYDIRQLMQYTGRKDKYGKEIYEGDICSCRMNGIDAHVEEVETEVIYDLTVGAFGHKVTSENSYYTFFGLNSKNLFKLRTDW